MVGEYRLGPLETGFGLFCKAATAISCNLAREYASASVCGLNIRTGIWSSSINPDKKKLKAWDSLISALGYN